jgi:uncharacterized protein YcbK (DUF882 family)
MKILKLKCFVDKDGTSTRRQLTKLKKRLPFLDLDIQEIDTTKFDWEIKNNAYYIKGETITSLTSELPAKEYHGVMLFIENWKNSERRLFGFKYGRMFNGLDVMVTKYRSKYEGTADHELMHFVNDFIKRYSGVNLNSVFKVKDFDRDVVHSKDNENYEFSDEWKIIMPYLETAIDNFNNGKKDTAQMLRELIKQSLGMVKPKSITEKETLVVKSPYKYFSSSEVKGLQHEFVLLLDKARGIAGIPFVINSGYRTKEHNKKVGGVPNSAHLSGLAVDIRARTGAEAYAIIKSAMEVGIKRIGINRNSQFVHLDIDYSKPNPTIYEY